MIVIIAGGHKVGYLADQGVSATIPSHYLLMTLLLPCECECFASRAALIGFFPEINAATLQELLLRAGDALPAPAPAEERRPLWYPCRRTCSAPPSGADRC